MHSIILHLLAVAAAVTALPLLDTRATCSGAHVLWARGTNETYANSRLNPLVNNIQQATAGSSSAIIYDASLAPTSPQTRAYQLSVAQGINNTIAQIQGYVAQCGSKSKIVLVGYSQGGQVMTDTLAGGAFEPPGIDPSYWPYITATVVFGDTTFTYPSSYAAGNATSSGVFQRASNDPSQTILNNDFAKTLRSYCTAGDPICSGLQNTNVEAHLSEIRDHQAEAQAFVLKFFGK